MSNRFRPKYRDLSETEKSQLDNLKAKAEELEELIDEIKDGRYKSLALTELEQSIMWAVKEITT